MMDKSLKRLQKNNKIKNTIPGFDNCWSDSVWRVSHSSPGSNRRTIKWDFDLNDGSKFTDITHHQLLHTSKDFILSLILNPPIGKPVITTSTLCIKSDSLRMLVSWMIANGINKFTELDKTIIQDYVLYLRIRKGNKGKELSESTFTQHVNILRELYLQREKIPNLPQMDLTEEIFKGRNYFRTYNNNHWPYTPDDIAIPLINGAIRFLREVSTALLDVRDEYAEEYWMIIDKGCSNKWAQERAGGTIKKTTKWQYNGNSIEWVKTPDTGYDLSRLLLYIVPACFIILSYLVGMRFSEIVGLKRNCVTKRKINGNMYNFIRGRIYKNAGPGGRSHEWVVSEEAVFAINILERFTQPLNILLNRDDIWLTRSDRRTALIEVGRWKYEIRSITSVVDSLNRFAHFLNIPKIQQGKWRLTTHQGRITFARFVASRDRTSFLALSEHFGHLDRLITEQGYGYFDNRLQNDIGNNVVKNSIVAWESMLSAKSLAGKAGTEIRQNRDRFGGEMMDQDISRMAEIFVNAGLKLAVCNWGFCVYRSEYSACHGTTFGPNPIHREPSTCAKCKNFVVTEKHKGYWEGQREINRSIMNEKEIPEQTRTNAAARFNEAERIISSLESEALVTNK